MNNRFLTLLFVVLYTAMYAQTSSGLQSRLLNSFDGLSSDHVKQSIEDNDGMMWFATSKGLNRYDGKNILRYKASENNENGIPHDDVRSLLLTQSGELWIGTQKGLVKKLNNDRFAEISNKTLGANVFPSDQIIKLIQGKNGNIWIATHRALVIMSPDLKNYHTYKASNEQVGIGKSNPNLIPNSDIVDIFEDRFGNIWLTTWAGGLTLAISDTPSDLHSYQFSTLNSDDLEIPKNLTFKKIMQDENDKIWLQEAYGVFFRLDISDINLDDGLSKDKIKLKRFKFGVFNDDNYITTSSYIKGIGIFASTYRGSYVIPLEKLKESEHANIENKIIEGLALGSDTKENIFVDSRNILWIASNKGVFVYFGFVNSLFDKLPQYPSIIGASKISGIYHDKAGSWLGTDENLYLDNQNELQVIKYHQESIEKVSCFNKTSDGHLWVGTITGKLFEIENKTDGYRVSQHKIEGLEDYNGNNHIWNMLISSNGDLWLATHAGVYIYNRDSKTSSKLIVKVLEMELSTFNCFDIVSDKNETIYISATGVGLIIATKDASKEGGFHFELKGQGSLKSEISNNVIFDLDINDGKIWLAQGTGIEVYDISLDSFYRIRLLDESINSQVYSVIAAPDKIWATTPMGLSSYVKKDSVVYNFNIVDGIIENHSMLGHYRDNNGDIYLAGSGGYHVIDNGSKYLKKVSKEIVLSHLSINNDPVNIGEKDPVFRRPILTKKLNDTEVIKFSHSHKNVVINFSVQDFISPHQYEYSYILKGISEDWIDIGQEQSINFAQLPQSDFELCIKAKDQFGQWTKAKPLSIEVITPIWKQPTSIIWLGLLAILGVYLVARYRARKSKQRNIELKNAVEQRTQELKEQNKSLEKYIESNVKLENFAHAASHDLKAPLRNISAFAGLLKRKLGDKLNEKELSYFTEIDSGTKRLNSLVDDILAYSKLKSDNVKLENTSISKIINEVIDAIQTTTSENKACISFEKNGALDLQLMDKIKVSRVIQNLLTNAIKFVPEDRSPEIKIWMEKDKNYKFIKIKDNGIGIAEENKKEIFNMFTRINHSSAYDGTGFGLTISKKIMNLHQGDLLVTSELGKGSVFTLKFPAN